MVEPPMRRLRAREGDLCAQRRGRADGRGRELMDMYDNLLKSASGDVNW